MPCVHVEATCSLQALQHHRQVGETAAPGNCLKFLPCDLRSMADNQQSLSPFNARCACSVVNRLHSRQPHVSETSMCGCRCVARYDHYCPWVGRTIGILNLRWFMLFLLLNILLCSYGELSPSAKHLYCACAMPDIPP